MSIFPAIIRLLKAEHAYRPIKGDLVLIGRQRVELPEPTSDVELFASFCSARVRALDVSPYEGAEIIHDLCTPLPDNLKGTADFIFDGSCLDNLFDPGMAIRSLSAMLRPGGRIMLFEHSTAIQGALVSFSPEWFFDFFAANHYEDCQIKLGMFTSMQEAWILQDWLPFDDKEKPVTASPDVGNFVSIVLAEKGRASTDDVLPIQGYYREVHRAISFVDPYMATHRKYLKSARRLTVS